MAREIIDFHTHPWLRDEDDICYYRDKTGNPAETFRSELLACGITRAVGAPIVRRKMTSTEEYVAGSFQANDDALALRDQLGDFYIPGMTIHPADVRGSCEQLERMHRAGVRLLGEMVPYLYGWGERSFAHEGLDEILDLAEQYSIVVNFHSMGARADEYDMIKRHPGVIFVGAHPGERPVYMRHLEWLHELPNYYLDLSGTGLFRHRMLSYGVRQVGAERFLFGSDLPVCSPGMNVGGVDYEPITDAERELIFAGNAKRLLGL